MVATSSLVVAGAPANPRPAAADTGVVEISGRGWGHGRGLGQYGARGYADQGWSSTRILDHFYGGTTSGPAPVGGEVDPAAVRVELRLQRGRATEIGLYDGQIVIRGADGGELARVGSGAARLVRDGNGYWLETSSGCGEPWSTQGRLDGHGELRLTAEGGTSLLHTCGPHYRTWYRGELRPTMDGSVPVLVNVVSIEDYLAGVVPNEMPASWPDAALESQVVAARSYALAGDTRQQPYADTCDSTRCQVYDGAYTERGGSFRASTHARTDAAIAATAGVVRLWPDGTVARTEFSSSTGGHTAGGTFPAVVDDGDGTSGNPNHTWSVTISTGRIEAHYGRGALLGIEVVERNGLGADGGRVERIELRFEGGTVTDTGDRFRSRLGLKSNWFTVSPLGASARRATPDGGYIDRTFRLFTGRDATDAEIDRWYEAVEGGDRRGLTGALVASEHFVGQLVDDLYQTALGRPADGTGRAYWVDQIGSGFGVEAAGVLFYGSPEYYQQAGGTDAGFVTELYRDLLHREPDGGGREYWVARLGDGSASLDDVVAGFYASLESRRDRSVALHQLVIGSSGTAATIDALAEQLANRSLLGVAADLAASDAALG